MLEIFPHNALFVRAKLLLRLLCQPGKHSCTVATLKHNTLITHTAWRWYAICCCRMSTFQRLLVISCCACNQHY